MKSERVRKRDDVTNPGSAVSGESCDHQVRSVGARSARTKRCRRRWRARTETGELSEAAAIGAGSELIVSQGSTPTAIDNELALLVQRRGGETVLDRIRARGRDGGLRTRWAKPLHPASSYVFSVAGNSAGRS
jgi:hypothetical protein